jgi:hypothetical protein
MSTLVGHILPRKRKGTPTPSIRSMRRKLLPATTSRKRSGDQENQQNERQRVQQSSKPQMVAGPSDDAEVVIQHPQLVSGSRRRRRIRDGDEKNGLVNDRKKRRITAEMELLLDLIDVQPIYSISPTPSVAPVSVNARMDLLLDVVRSETLFTATPAATIPIANPAPAPVSNVSSPKAAIDPDLDLKYENARQIGRGGYGIVFEAVDVSTGQHVAIKRQKKGKVAERELDVLKTVKSENCCKLLAVKDSTDEKSMFTVMPLYRQLPKLFSSEAELLRIMKGCARGLLDLQLAGYFHLDVKPQNILLGSADEGILCDFGFAAKFESNGMISERRGVPEFMAPEVKYASGKYSGWKADVYSLAKTIRKLACSTYSFLKPIISPKLHQLLFKMEAYDVEQRLSIQEVLEDPLLSSI